MMRYMHRGGIYRYNMRKKYDEPFYKKITNKFEQKKNERIKQRNSFIKALNGNTLSSPNILDSFIYNYTGLWKMSNGELYMMKEEMENPYK